jgi:hypothetical protein
MPALPLPNSPDVVGMKFYDQCAFLDPKANPLGLVVLASSGWVVGAGRKPDVTTVTIGRSSSQSPPYTWGGISRNFGAFAELHFQ